MRISVMREGRMGRERGEMDVEEVGTEDAVPYHLFDVPIRQDTLYSDNVLSLQEIRLTETVECTFSMGREYCSLS